MYQPFLYLDMRLDWISLFRECWILISRLAYSGVFALFLLACIVWTHYYYPESSALPRYDFLFIMAVLFQILLLVTRLETLQEVAVIMVFHAMAMVMEWFKTLDTIGSWQYPGQFYLGIAQVPLFVGFMYSAVGSALARGMRVFQMKLIHPPRLRWAVVLALLIYINFFSHHYMMNLRWPLLVVAIALYRKTTVQFTLYERVRAWPIVWAFTFVAGCLWLAENIATYAQVWVYPTQKNGWVMVDWDRMLAWYLLIQLSFTLVYALVNQKETRAKAHQ